MNTIFANLKVSAFISLVIVSPFLILEIINKQDLPGSFPYPLFGILWIVMLLFVFLIRPIVQSFQTGAPHLSIGNLITRSVLLISLAYFWVRIVIDQMPCFLGIPNCD